MSVDVTVTVADLEEKGTITVDNLNPGVGDSVIFTLTDPDGGIFTEGSANGFKLEHTDSRKWGIVAAD